MTTHVRDEDLDGVEFEPRFPPVDLATVDPRTPDLLLGVVYRGFSTTVFGPTGSAKTMLSMAYVLEAARSGLRVSQWDEELGREPVADRYRQMGATDRDLAMIAYHDWPGATLKDSDAFLEQVLADEADIALLDPTTDFLTAAGLDENANSEVTTWFARYPQRLTQAGVATILVDGSPHDAQRQRGATQKGYKAALAFRVEVIDEPTRDHVGEVTLTCTKDRFGVVGRGAVTAWAVGGDGRGRIVVDRHAARAQPSAEERTSRDRAEWTELVAATLAIHAPNEDRAMSQNQLVSLLPAGKGRAERLELCQRAATSPMASVRSKPGPRGSILYWHEAATGSDQYGPVPYQSEPVVRGEPVSTGSTSTAPIGNQSPVPVAGTSREPLRPLVDGEPHADPPVPGTRPQNGADRPDLRTGHERYLEESRGAMWELIDKHGGIGS